MNTQHSRDESLSTLIGLTSYHLASDAAGIAMSIDGKALTLASTDAVADEADRLQTHLEDGPAVTAVWPSAQLMVNGRDGPSPWPAWTQSLLDIGIDSILTTQIVTPTGRLGALTFYYAGLAPVSDHQLAAARTLAQQAAIQIHQAQAIAQLTEALDTRTRIGQAQGILMERFAIDSDQAFNVLRRYSQDTNTKLRVVADAVVTHGRLPDEAPTLSRRAAPAPPPVTARRC